MIFQVRMERSQGEVHVERAKGYAIPARHVRYVENKVEKFIYSKMIEN